jgi:hypothetical protein
LLLLLAFWPAVVGVPAVDGIPAVVGVPTVACITADAGLSLLLAYHEWFGTEFPACFSSMKGSTRNFQFFPFAEWFGTQFRAFSVQPSRRNSDGKFKNFIALLLVFFSYKAYTILHMICHDFIWVLEKLAVHKTQFVISRSLASRQLTRLKILTAGTV